VRTRATDRVGNVETPGAGANVIVDGAAPTAVLTVGGQPYAANQPPLLSQAYRQASGQFFVPITGLTTDPAIGTQAGQPAVHIYIL